MIKFLNDYSQNVCIYMYVCSFILLPSRVLCKMGYFIDKKYIFYPEMSVNFPRM